MPFRSNRSLVIVFLLSLGISGVMTFFLRTDLRAQTAAANATVTILSPAHNAAVPRGITEVKYDVKGGTATRTAMFLVYVPARIPLGVAPAGCVNSTTSTWSTVACYNLTSDKQITLSLDTKDVPCEQRISFYTYARFNNARSWASPPNNPQNIKVSCAGGTSQSSSKSSEVASSVSSASRPPPPLELVMLAPSPPLSFDTLARAYNRFEGQWKMTNNTDTDMANAAVTLSMEHENVPIGQLPAECTLSSYRQADCKFPVLKARESKTLSIQFLLTPSHCKAEPRLLAYAWAQGVTQVSLFRNLKVDCGANHATDAKDVKMELQYDREIPGKTTFPVKVILTNTGQATLTNALLRLKLKELGGPRPVSVSDPQCKIEGWQISCTKSLTQNMPVEIATTWSTELECGQKLPIVANLYVNNTQNTAYGNAENTCSNVVITPATAENPKTIWIGVPFSIRAYFENKGKMESGPANGAGTLGNFLFRVEADPNAPSSSSLKQEDVKCFNGSNGKGHCNIPHLRPGGNDSATLNLVVSDKSFCGKTIELKGKLWGIPNQYSTPGTEITIPLEVKCHPTLQMELTGPSSPILVGGTGIMTLKLRNLGPGRIEGGWVQSLGIASYLGPSLLPSAIQPDANCKVVNTILRCYDGGTFPDINEGDTLTITGKFEAKNFSCTQQGSTWSVNMSAPISGLLLGAPGNTNGFWLEPKTGVSTTVTVACPSNAVSVSYNAQAASYEGNTVALPLTVRNPGQTVLSGTKVRVKVKTPYSPAAIQADSRCRAEGGTVLCTLDLSPGDTPISVLVARPPVNCGITDKGIAPDGAKEMDVGC